ncbi:gliding motility-associated C-terminal domain-containing protein [Bizionia echini]|uniref:Gliding motility-associated C-terminal domain-containing protein n=2 Tax=Bizionia echini TaxID=649333 RepID=A0A1I4ZCV0_9FLAO|nr:gliding motility-associated C-terminal domain-containing protein [Bizionia echini]
MKSIAMNKLLILGFFIILFSQTHAQEPNDCVNAITVCGNDTFASNVQGPGNVQELSGCNNGNPVTEQNIFWIKIDIVQGGTLGFDLIPNDPALTVDYDFWVYGPNRLCSNLGSPIRCSTTNPDAAGLANNHTGMNDSTIVTQTGPGANGTGYVYWLNVVPGESYYIAIDRFVGDDGFQIQWTGSAMTGTGAFPEPPTANAIDDVLTCSSNPNIGLFDLNSLKNSINADPGTTIDFYPSLADAIDGTNVLPIFYSNTSNPQQIYAKVTSGSTECYSLVDFNLVVSAVPTATVVASDTGVCEGDAVTFTITGTPNATVHYNVNSGITQSVLLDTAGSATFTENPTVNITVELEDAQVINASNAVICSQALNETVSITVNPLITPTFTQVASICEGDALAPLPTTSTNGVTGTWSPSIDNTTTTTYTFTPDVGQCAVQQTMEIIVNPSVTPVFTQVAPICEGDALAPLPTTSNNGIIGTWSPALDNTATTIYTFTPNAGQCSANQTMEIVVNPNTSPTFIQVSPICEGDALAPLPTTSINGVTGSWSPSVDNTTTTTYTFTPDAGQCGLTQTMEIIVNPSSIPTFTQVAPICEGDALIPLPTTSNNGITGTWSPTLDNTTTTTYTFTPDAGQCAFSQTMEIIVNPIINPIFTQVAPICEGDALAPLPTTSTNGVIGSWSPAIDNTTTTTYTFTPNVGQCATTETMQIIVNPTVTPVFTQVAPICEGDALAPLPTTSTNGITGTWSPVLDNTTTTTYTFTPTNGQCGLVQTMEIIVNPLPVIAEDSVLACSVSGTGFFAFDLDAEIPNILGNSQSVADFTVTFYFDATGTNMIPAGPYTNGTPYSETIYVTISNNNSSCSITVPYYLMVEDAALATMPNPVEICDDDGTNDGVHEFDLTSLNPQVLNGQNDAIYEVSYYTDSLDAENGNNPIQNPETFVNTDSPYNQTIYIRVINSNIPDICFATTSVAYTVSPILKPIISSADGTNTICVDFDTDILQNQITLVSDIQGANYDYTWYLNGTIIPGATQETYVVNTVNPGLYTVSVVDTQSVANCNSEISEPFEVIQSGQAVFVSVSQSGAFEPNPSITVTVEGYGDYWFQLDNGPILDNGGVFTNVSGGLHTVYVYDRKTENPSCGFITIDDIRIIDYPKVVTPNQDGFNDTWNIKAFSNQPSAQIDIFDRYGKILASIKPSRGGWDGTYKGNNLPSSDYWFVLTYEEFGVTKQFRSHFSLKR